MASPENAEGDRVDPEKKEDTGPSFVETVLPIPDFFYDVRATLPLIGASPGKVRTLTNVIYLVTIGVFVATFAYYSLPAQLLSEEIVISSEWQKPGYVCKPLQKAAIHGFNTDWGYDECVAGVVPPSAESVNAATKHLDATHFDYEFARDGDANKGVVSFYDVRYDSSVLQLATNAWEREGYSCFPEPPYQGRSYNVPYNYTECFDQILEPSSETVQARGVDTFSYLPFGNLGSEQSSEGFADIPNSFSSIEDQYSRSDSAMCNAFAGLYPSNMPMPGEYIYSCSNSNIADAVSGWGAILATYGQMIYEEICVTLKQNPTGFRCFNQPKPPTTKEQAIERYASEYPAETICEPVKHNSPFQCTRTVEAPMVTRLSLSLASAQAVFAIVGIMFVTILRKMKVEASSATPKAVVSENEAHDIIKLYLKRSGGHIV